MASRIIKRDLKAMFNTQSQMPDKPAPRVLQDEEFEHAPPTPETPFAMVKTVIETPTTPPKLLQVKNMVQTARYDHGANGQLLTIKQVCRMFNVTPMSVYHWRQKLEFPTKILGGGKNPPVRFDEGCVLEWAKENQRTVVNLDYLDWI